MKKQLNEVRRMQALAGILNEDIDGASTDAMQMAQYIAKKYGNELLQVDGIARERLALKYAGQELDSLKGDVVARNLVGGLADEDWPMEFVSNISALLRGKSVEMDVDSLNEGVGSALDDLKSHLGTSSILATDLKYDFIQRAEAIEEMLEMGEEGVRMEIDELEEEVLAAVQGSDEDFQVYSEIFNTLKAGVPEDEDQGPEIDYLSSKEYDYLDNDQMDQLGLEEYTGGGKNPEGDKLVLRFLQGIAKKFDYPVAQAAQFVKERMRNLGY
jgi:hypothetical protein